MSSDSFSSGNSAQALWQNTAPEVPIVSVDPSSNHQQRPEFGLPGYRLIERIGRGGYGEVWRAEAPGGLTKAVKILHGTAADKHASEELKALSRIKDLRHPFLLSLERIEVVNGQLVIVTELADSSLKDYFESCSQLGKPGIPRDELLRFLTEAADALDFINGEHGLQHLDVKPDNLLVVGRHLKVADFGLVKNLYGQSISMVGGLTPQFAAPENFDGRPSDRSDQYSLAIVYQLLLTGKCPFDGSSMAQLASQHLHARPNLESLPETDRPIIAKALAKDPFDRFDNCLQLIDRLLNTKGAVLPRSPQVATSQPASRKLEAPRNDMHTEVVELELSSGGPTQAPAPTDTESISAAVPVQSTDGNPLQDLSAARLQPTLFIGLGSCGGRTLRALHQRLTKKWGALSEIPSFRFLYIDTDYQGFRESFVDHKVQTLTESEFLHIPLKNSDYYRSRPEASTRWLSRRWLFNIPKSQKTEGIRPLGRLALIDHIDQVARHLSRELDQLLDAAQLSQSAERTGLAPFAEHPRVVVFGALSSGTGGGTAWDILQLARQLLPESIQSEAELICAMAHWSSTAAKDLELSRVNTCASLKELQHLVTEGSPGDPAAQISPIAARYHLFDKVYLADLGIHASDIGFTEAAEQLAEYLEIISTTVGGEFTRRCLEDSSRSSDHSLLKTFSTSRISEEALAAIPGAISELAELAVSRWLGTPPAFLQEHCDTVALSKLEPDSWSAERFLSEVEEPLRSQSEKLAEHLSSETGADHLNSTEAEKLKRRADELLPLQQDLEQRTSNPFFAADMQVTTTTIKSRLDSLQTAIVASLDAPGGGIAPALSTCDKFLSQSGQAINDLDEMRSDLELKIKEVSTQLGEILKGNQEVSAQEMSNYVALRRRMAMVNWAHLVAESQQDFVNRFGARLKKLQASMSDVADKLHSLRSNVESQSSPLDETPRFKDILIAIQYERLGALVSAVEKETLQSLTGKSTGLSGLLASPPKNTVELSQNLLKTSQAKMVQGVLSQAVKGLENPLSSCGGVRRVMLAAPESLRKTGLVQLLLKELPKTTTLVNHDRREVLLLSNIEGLPIAPVAWHIAQQRADLIQLAGRLATRTDISWQPLS